MPKITDRERKRERERAPTLKKALSIKQLFIIRHGIRFRLGEINNTDWHRRIGAWLSRCRVTQQPIISRVRALRRTAYAVLLVHLKWTRRPLKILRHRYSTVFCAESWVNHQNILQELSIASGFLRGNKYQVNSPVSRVNRDTSDGFKTWKKNYNT